MKPGRIMRLAIAGLLVLGGILHGVASEGQAASPTGY
jgi:hypothetical protein